MGQGKVRSLVVRPIQSVDVAAERSGTVAQYNTTVRLGASVRGVDREALLASLAVPEASGRMKDAAAVHALMAAGSLVRLANEEDGLELNAAVLDHYNRLLSGLADPIRVATILSDFHRKKRSLLDEQLTAHHDKAAQLDAAYGAGGVVKQSQSTQRFANNVGQFSTVHLNTVAMATGQYKVNGTYQPGNGTSSVTYDRTVAVPVGFNPANGAYDAEHPRTPVSVAFDAGDQDRLNPKVDGFLSQVERTVVPPQTLVTDLVDLRHPRLEQRVGDLRIEQQLLEALADSELGDARVTKLIDILKNDAAQLAVGVAMAQLRYAKAYLGSDVSGVVTAIYKDVGEYVQAGEAILRIENDAELLLVGQVQHKGLVGLGRSVEVQLKNLAEAGDEVVLKGEVVVVRGHSADDDEWEVTLLVKGHRTLTRKTATGQVLPCVLPLNLHIDHLDSVIHFV